ncbi:hypothetical protein NDU88_007894 [Pleurodeles waltl]|uniref:Uncharacterized protein n=1 Tax=Pleurodeles waltl TaxID=8319 RepID=A0AAV7PMY9_PLEWA|nr:hypothetical protein NDU88_007894 [Pleurodeles waltl]
MLLRCILATLRNPDTPCPGSTAQPPQAGKAPPCRSQRNASAEDGARIIPSLRRGLRISEYIEPARVQSGLENQQRPEGTYRGGAECCLGPVTQTRSEPADSWARGPPLDRSPGLGRGPGSEPAAAWTETGLKWLCSPNTRNRGGRTDPLGVSWGGAAWAPVEARRLWGECSSSQDRRERLHSIEQEAEQE